MKLKKTWIFTLLFASGLFLTGCNQTESDMSGYDVDRNHTFVDLSMEEALEKLTTDFEGILYFGFPECPWCRAAIFALVEAANETNTKIYYVSRHRDFRTDEWNELDATMAWWLYDRIDMDFIYDDEDEPIRPNIFVPMVVHLRHGEVVSYHRGTFAGHVRVPMAGSEQDVLPDLTDEQYTTLLNIYRDMLAQVGACSASVTSEECD